MREYSLKTVITRVILARNDVLTPFDLRAQIFRVNVELSAYYRVQKIFRKKYSKMTFFEKIIILAYRGHAVANWPRIGEIILEQPKKSRLNQIQLSVYFSLKN